MQSVIKFNSRTQGASFLSNFYRSPINIPVEFPVLGTSEKEVLRITFSTVEGAYQFMKFPVDHRTITLARLFADYNGFQAKAAGKSITVRPDWHAIKVNVMTGLIKAKFNQNKPLRQQLIDTNDCLLWHDSPWDTYWGFDDRGRGYNMLGQILMRLRAELATK